MREPDKVKEELRDIRGAAAHNGEAKTEAGAQFRGRVSELEEEGLKALWWEAVDYARREIGRYACWRGREEPVLAGGYDAEGLVQAGFERLLMEEAADGSIGYSVEELQQEVKNLIRHRVRWLHERAETGVLVSEWEVLVMGEEEQSLFDYLPGNIQSPDAALMEKEKAEMIEQAGKEIEAGLSNGLREVFGRSWKGQRRRQIAREMGQPVKRIKALQAQVKRRVVGWGGKGADLLNDLRDELVMEGRES